jgi:hypothetical protein
LPIRCDERNGNGNPHCVFICRISQINGRNETNVKHHPTVVGASKTMVSVQLEPIVGDSANAVTNNQSIQLG